MSRTTLAAALALAAVPAASPAVAGAREVDRPQPRLVVSDGERGRVSVHALRSGRALGAFRVAEPASLSTAGDGRYALAVQYGRDRVDVIDGGSWSEPHGDHDHHHARPPRRTLRLRAPAPSHAVSHGGTLAVFADGTGTAHLLRETQLRRRGRPSVREVAADAPHHGVAVPYAAGTLVSSPDPAAAEGGLPSAVALHDARGRETGRFGPCPELHGEAAGAGWAAFACADGVLLVEGAEAPAATLVPYPPGTGSDARAWSLAADADGRRLVAAFGEDELLVVDRAARRARTVALGRAATSVAVRSARAAVVLTADGRVHGVDLARGAVTGSARVSGRAREDRPSPRLAVGAGRAVVSDPARSRVRVLRAGDLRTVRTVRTGGAPHRIVITGAP